MRLFILACLLLVIDWFSFQVVRFFLQDADRGVRIALYSAFWAIPVFTLVFAWSASQGYTDDWPKAVRVLISTFLMILYFSKFTMGLVVLIDDIRRLVMWTAAQFRSDDTFSPARSRFLTQLSITLGALPFLSLTYGVLRNPYRYKVYEETVRLKNLPETLEGLRIVQISDIHSGSFLLKEPVERSVEMINELEADLVFFTGDLVNSKADEVDNFVDIFSNIKARHGVYSVLGNHDYGDYHRWPNTQAKEANFQLMKDQHRRLGWDLMLNEHRIIKIDDASVGIIGVENYSANRRFAKYGDLPASVQGMEPTDVRILLSHDPSHWKEQVIEDFKTIDLTLSGHTHGFQFGVEIPGYLKWSPVQYVYKEWAGLYREGEQYLYVNRGLGYLGYPGRVGILPEITLLTLEGTD